jgi:hypothetical protein
MKKKANGSSTAGRAAKRRTVSTSPELVTTRGKLVGNILYYAGDEFETTDDITELAMESEEELVDRLINLLDYYYDKANELS